MARGLPVRKYYISLTSGQSYTLPDDALGVHITPTSTLAAANIIMPINPNYDQLYYYVFHQAITLLTTTLSPGQLGFVGSVPTVIAQDQRIGWSLSVDNKWYREF